MLPKLPDGRAAHAVEAGILGGAAVMQPKLSDGRAAHAVKMGTLGGAAATRDKRPDGRAESAMASAALRAVAAAAPSKETGQWICTKDPTRRIFTAAISLSGRNRTTRQVQCAVCKCAFSLAHFTRVDAPPTQPSQPTIPQLFNPPAAKKQKQEVHVID
jgi:hypothetical protein